MFSFNITDYHKVGGYIINNVKVFSFKCLDTVKRTDDVGLALL